MTPAPAFLRWFFEDADPDLWLLLWGCNNDDDKRSFWYRLSDIERAEAFVPTLTQRYRNSYFGVGLRDRDHGSSRRGGSDDVVAICGLWADLDLVHPVHKKGNLPTSRTEVEAILEAAGVRPSALIQSGHGLQAYWRFKEPWVFSSPKDRQAAIDLVQGWHETLKALYRERGFDSDSVFDFARLMRVPGSTNRKEEDDPRPVEILFLDGPLCNPDDFVDFIIPAEQRTPPAEVGDLSLRENACPPAAKFEQLLKHPKVLATWEHKRENFSNSLSSYDQSLATFAALEGWEDQEIADLIIAHRVTYKNDPIAKNDSVKKGLRPDYHRRTIGRARAKAKEIQERRWSLLPEAPSLQKAARRGALIVRSEIGPDPSGNTVAPVLSVVEEARARIDVDTLYTRLTENRRCLLEDDQALYALACIRKFDPKTWARVKDIYRELRLGTKDLEKALPPVRIETPEADAYDGPAPRTSAEFLSDSPAPQLIIPEPYRLADHMTARSSVDDDGTPQLTTFAFAPILITGRLRDADDGTEHLRVSWRRPQQGWIDRTVDRGQAFNPRELLKLASVGAPVADDNAKDISAYLHRLEAANQHNLPCARVSSHLAWQGPMGKDGFLWGRQLILPNGTQTGDINLDELPPDDWREDFIAFHGNAQGDDLLAAGFTASGTMEGWIDAVKVLADFPKPLVGIYASFAAVLLEIVGAPNHIWDFANRTSTGKTTTLRVAGSVWGCPDEKADASVIGTWDATRVYAERASAVLSNLPLILDDTKRAKNPRDVAAMLYAVANGRGRGRGNPKGLATTKAWRTILLSSGEAPATSFTEDGGTKTRCLEIRGAPFGKETEETRRLVTRINYGVTAHYGHAGPAFVRYLYQNRGKWDTYREQYRQIRDRLAEKTTGHEAGRLAEYGAVVILAATLAHAALDLPWSFKDPLESIWAAVTAEAADAAGELKALRDVMDWAHSNAAAFYGRHQYDKDGNAKIPSTGRLGLWENDENWAFIGFHSTKLKDQLQRMGYEPAAILHGWKERGWLDVQPGDPTRLTKRVKMDGENPHLIVLPRDKGIKEAEAC